MTTCTTNEAFDTAYQQFRDSLPEVERSLYAPCATAEDLLDGLTKLKILSAMKQQHKKHVIKIIESFSERLQPYFDTVAIFAQSNQYACVAWGALRLVLQLASNFATFFGKLTTLIQALTNAFPQYGEIRKIFSGEPPMRMKQSVEELYGEVLQFFQSVAQIFITTGGKIRRGPAVICDLMWTPFDVRFKDLLTKLEHHGVLVSSELNIANARMSKTLQNELESEGKLAREQLDRLSSLSQQMKSELEKKNKDCTFQQAHQWLFPPDYAEIFQKACEVRQANTCHWISEDTGFKNWRDGDWSIRESAKKSLLSANALWIRGKAGSGKTTLASAIITELEDIVLASGEPPTACYYFFSRQYPNSSEATASAAYRAILSQILYRHRNDNSIVEKFAFSIAGGTAQLKGSSGELVELLQLCCQHLGCVYLVLDGIDECDDNADLVTTLRILTSCSCLKVVMLSRANVSSLNTAVKSIQRLEMDRMKLDVDIKVYLSAEISLLIEDELLISCETADIVDNLVQGADGMFLWAKLMVKYLRSVALTPVKRLTTIRQVILPEGLEKMYDRILELISHTGRTEQQLAKLIFSWALHAKQPLTIRQIYEVAHFHDFERDRERLYEGAEFRDTIDIVCGSLMEYFLSSARNQQYKSQPEDKHYAIRFIHLSVKEHFMEVCRRSQCNNNYWFVPREPDVHLNLARYCLEYMVTIFPQLSNRPLEFTSYSTLYWVDHLVDVIKFDQTSTRQPSLISDDGLHNLVAVLKGFLHNPAVIASWMQFYLTEAPPFTREYLPLRDLSRWAYWLKNIGTSTSDFEKIQQLSQLISEFVQDMHVVIDTWGSKLRSCPDIVQDEVSLFTNSRFLTVNRTTKIISLAPKSIDGPSRSSRPLCTISTTAADSSIHSVLSVWPSKRYEERWQDLKANDPISRVREFCSGWIARYEIWDALGQQCLADIRVPIDEDEVWLHMRQSMHEEDREWRTSFPLEISKNARCFVILRSVFIFHAPANSSSATYQTIVLPVDLISVYGAKWSKNMDPYESLGDNIQDIPLRAIHRDRYTYTVTFCPNGRYLSFIENSWRGNLAVFELIRGTVPQAKLLNHTPRRNFSPDSIKTSFHPSADLIAISTLDSLWIWYFRESTDGIVQLKSYLNSTVPNMSMSSCGKFIVLVGNGAPVVVEIPEAPTNLDELNPAPYVLTRMGRADLSRFSVRTGQLQKAKSTVSCHNGKVSSVLTVRSGDRPTICLTGIGDHLNTEQQLDMELEMLNLPPSADMDHTTPSIMISKASQDTVQLAINMDSRLDYSMIGPQNSNLPMLIERDARAIRQFVSTNITMRDMISFKDDENEEVAVAHRGSEGGL